jgi:lysyl-tRNA synthetase class 2
MPSSVIRSFRYYETEQRLLVEFTTGRRYSYLSVPEETATGLRQSFSKGEFFNAHIRDHFRFVRER